MWTRYVAYGLQLRSSFPLPGMQPRTSRGLPSLALSLTAPAELEAAWSGGGGPPWRGRLGDGCEMTVERGVAGDVLFRYGDRASFRLHDCGRQLDCAVSVYGMEWQRALVGKVLCSVSIMRGYEGLHAAVVDSPPGVLAFVGANGAGKSTMAIEFLRRGWPLFADDVLTLRRHAHGICAYPGPPHATLDGDGPHAMASRGLGIGLARLSGEVWLAAEGSPGGPRPVRALCLLTRAPAQRLELDVLPANPLVLAPHMLGFTGEHERQRSRFDLYADLADDATMVRLSADLEEHPSHLADLLEQALAPRASEAERATPAGRAA